MANFMRFDFQRGLWLNSTDGGQTFSDAANGLLKGTLANRPAAGLGRRFYFATDTAGLFYDNGTAWVPIGGGGNADTLDGQDGTYYLARANHTGTQAPATISPQGAGSGLGADTLDGYHASDLLNAVPKEIPSGAKMIFKQSSTPSGWTFLAEDNDRVLINTSTLSGGGALGGSWTVGGLSINGHALTIAEMPSHRHETGVVVNGAYSTDVEAYQRHGNVAQTLTGSRAAQVGTTPTHMGLTNYIGGGTAHSHGISSDGSWRPLAVAVITCRKN